MNARATAPSAASTYVSMSEAARMIGVSRWMIRKRVIDGQLPAVRVGNGQAIRVKVSDLDALLRPIAVADLDGMKS